MSYDYENIEQIKQLKYRYCRGIDSCNIEELGRVFTEDARINYQVEAILLKPRVKKISSQL